MKPKLREFLPKTGLYDPECAASGKIFKIAKTITGGKKLCVYFEC